MNIAPQTQNLLITASILAVVVTVLVLVNTPSPSEAQTQQNKTSRLFKVFIIAFFLSAIVLYIMTDNDSNAMMTNIIKGEPDF